MMKAHPPTGKKAAIEARAVEIMRGDPQMRQEFINRVAPPIANKLFECGMIHNFTIFERGTDVYKNVPENGFSVSSSGGWPLSCK